MPVEVEVLVEVPVEVLVDVPVLVPVGGGLGIILSHGITTMTILTPHTLPERMRTMRLTMFCSRLIASCWEGSPVGSGTSTISGSC